MSTLGIDFGTTNSSASYVDSLGKPQAIRFIGHDLKMPTVLSFYGGNPFSELKNPFIMAKSSRATSINNLIIPGLSIIDLSGHSPGLIGILTSDDVLFVGDSYTSDKNLESYSLQYVFDVEKYLKTLSFLQKQNFRYFVASHDIIRDDIKDIINLNINNVNSIISNILYITTYI